VSRPVLLDLFCGAGGASYGYVRAGFDVLGVDIEPQPNYRWPFVQADVFEFLARGIPGFVTAVHASPPCFLNSTLAHVLPVEHGHRELIPQTREALAATGLPYVIENVPGAELLDPVLLCGSMFGLGTQCGDGKWRELRRHRLFEANFELTPPPPCQHWAPSLGVHGGGPKVRQRRSIEGRAGYQGTLQERQTAMRISWMTRRELNLAIPPQYTQWLGAQLPVSVVAE
jgi:DNA (cytosine-5)-methyltransferase 1